MDEPPELTGEPKKVRKAPEALQELEGPYEEKDVNKARAGIEKLTKVLQEHPDYSDGYFMRAQFNRCMMDSTDPAAVVRDIDTAISTYPAQKFPRQSNPAEHYSLRAKVDFDTGHLNEAMDDLERAVREDIGGSRHLSGSFLGPFRPDPGTTHSNPCAWSLSDFDRFVREAPNDYRSNLFRGLYYGYFMIFNKQYFSRAIADIQKAINLNPKSALNYYGLGDTYTSAPLSPSLGFAQRESYASAIRESAIRAYNRAVELDPKLAAAFLERAYLHRDLGHYQQAIHDFDKVLELDPENLDAYWARGLAKEQSGQHREAIWDYSEVIRRVGPDYSVTGSICLEKRAILYLESGDYSQALSDLTKAIELELGQKVFLLSLGQFRALYPEYDSVPDEVLGRKLNKLFWPEYDYAKFAKYMTENKYVDEELWTLNELYEERGDAYLRAGEFKKGVSDFNRIFRANRGRAAETVFESEVERWRLLGSIPGDEDYYVDVKTVEFPNNGPKRLWLKRVNENGSHTVQSYEIDCQTKQLKVNSTVRYGPDDKVVGTSDIGSGWQHIVPDTVGERLYSGICPSGE